MPHTYNWTGNTDFILIFAHKSAFLGHVYMAYYKTCFRIKINFQKPAISPHSLEMRINI